MMSYETYASTLFRIATVRLGSCEDAKEAIQDPFIKLMEKAPDFKNAEHRKAWLSRVITNRLLAGSKNLNISVCQANRLRRLKERECRINKSPRNRSVRRLLLLSD
ncbi:hypothetical protein JW799_14145 [Cohnella algarum]|nr:hypothetical protein [Cohnella algarum]